MNAPGVLLDTGPLVALLSRDDGAHALAARLFDACQPPLRTCEAVVAEACFLMRKVDRRGPAEIAALGRRGLFEVGLSLDAHWAPIEALLAKYQDEGVTDLDNPRILQIPPFDAMGTPVELIGRFGTRRDFERAASLTRNARERAVLLARAARCAGGD